ncbi:MAG: DUF2252 family protein [Deltaproteobacteria bacterium]|nr:DUF2252 family protein [Nannocystaceae bacterium]
MLLLAGCAAADDERGAWLRHTLVLDNQDFLERDPELTQGKLARMAETPYAYFRGSAAQFARDVLEPGGAALVPWRFTDAEVDDVALVGDPHPENIGGYLTGNGTLTVDFNDFDAATYGPFELDLRRLGLGFWVACVQGGETSALLDDAACTAIVAACARGYADEIIALAEDPDDATIVTEQDPHGLVMEALFEDAREDGDDGKPLGDYTVVEGGTRQFLDGDLEPARLLRFGSHSQVVFEDTVHPPSAAQDKRVRALIEQWRGTVRDPQLATPTATRVVGITRRYGAGVSSYPVLRFYVLLAGPTDAPEDDVMLELKEVRDPPPLPGLRRPIDAPYGSNGSRVIGFARELQGFIDDDPWAGWADDGGQSFRVRERSGYQNGFNVVDLPAQLEAGEWRIDHVEEFAATSGRILARSHARARRARGTMAGPAIARAIGDGVALVDDVVAFVEGYAPIVLGDRARLAELIAADGPDLGYGAW